MVRSGIQAVILAAGSSSRFGTTKTKLSFPICGQELVAYPAKLLAEAQIPIVCIVGYQKEVVKAALARHNLPSLTFVEQTEPRGTGHALLCARDSLYAELVLVINGDVPLVTREIIDDLIETHRSRDATITLVTSQSPTAAAEGYGRIVYQDGKLTIVEARNYTENRDANQYINAGIYLFKRSFLEQALPLLQANAKTGEIYLTDLVYHASIRNEPVATTYAAFDSVRGINTLKELWAAEHIKRSDLISQWMSQGVRFIAAQNVYLDLDVTIGMDTTIAPGAMILQGSSIGKGCSIGAYAQITSSIIHDNAIIQPHTIVTNTTVHSHAQIGPFAHLRSSTIQPRAIVGNFVEINRTTLGRQTKAKHLSYLGDAVIGAGVNIGAGTITCNYDGIQKYTTIIHDNALIGSNNALVAPVTIGANAMTGAGSVITSNVPDDALAIARARQEVKENYAQRFKTRPLCKTTDNHTPTTSSDA
ncbi:MAG: bifunctional UDP-N-acetylglucosamine diphosphorylase/glucosamine-1-phosphate N-acetyltransferase GlmU [Candidatus Dependentiae bacterium]|nr:bifunctional UDP-N-acetylglucosamine diphosphorylase/glucosamine-1-phosphate N-acetyltransferase GlmU [Candidatus Dependentiae bacterium]